MTTMQQITPPPPRTDQAPEDFAAARTRLLELEKQARTLVRERPVAAMLAAVGFGYVIARLFSGRSR